MSEGSDQGASCQHISEIMFPADFINLSEKLQEVFLFLRHGLSFLINCFQNFYYFNRLIIEEPCTFCPFIADHDHQFL